MQRCLKCTFHTEFENEYNETRRDPNHTEMQQKAVMPMPVIWKASLVEKEIRSSNKRCKTWMTTCSGGEIMRYFPVGVLFSGSSHEPVKSCGFTANENVDLSRFFLVRTRDSWYHRNNEKSVHKGTGKSGERV